MFQLLHTMMEAGLASVVLVPVLLILNRIRFHDIRLTIRYLFFAIYLAGVYGVVGLPNISYIRFDPSIQWIPFADMFSDLSGTVLNVIMFVPFGLFLPLLWKNFQTPGKLLASSFCFSLFIELLQLFTYRATDVNDLISNTLGALIGWTVSYMMIKCFPSCFCHGQKSDLPLLTAVSFGVMFCFQPLIWMIIE